MASTIFSGNSRYASDFQSVIDRSVAIASLPLAQLNNTKLALTNEATALTSLQTKLTNFQSAVEKIGAALGSNSLQTTLVPSGPVSASVSEGAGEGTYTIEVTSLGSYANTMSNNTLTTVADPAKDNLTASTSLTLTVGAKSFQLTPAGGSLNDLVSSINAAGAGVRASIVNVGSTSSPSYRLSVQNSALGDVPIQLNDGSQDLLSTLSPGALATYKVNGLNTEVESDSRTVTLAPGLTITLAQKSEEGKPTTIDIQRTNFSLQNALQSFADSYNAIVTELDLHRGSAKGALSGSAAVTSAASVLRTLGTYTTASGDISTLTNLGLEFSKEGKLSLNTTLFSQATGDDFSAVTTFLGSADKEGFLKFAGDTMDGLLDSEKGSFPSLINSVNNQITRQNALIDDNQQRISALQTSLESQMAAADAMIASLEQQATYMNNLFDSMRAASESLNA